MFKTNSVTYVASIFENADSKNVMSDEIDKINRKLQDQKIKDELR